MSAAPPIERTYQDILGRLLTEGPARDDFAVDPLRALRNLGADDEAVRTLEKVPAADLEAQATVLLRKRYLEMEEEIPELIARLRGKAWPLFETIARPSWLPPEKDAQRFLDVVAQQEDPALATTCDWNRWRFFLDAATNLRCHWVRDPGQPPRLQILLCDGDGICRQFVITFSWGGGSDAAPGEG